MEYYKGLALLGGGAYLLCVLIVAFDKERRGELVWLFLYLPWLGLLALPGVYLLYTQVNGLEPLMPIGKFLVHTSDWLANKGVSLLALPFAILAFLLTILLPISTPLLVIITAVAGIVAIVSPGAGTFLLIPFWAVQDVLRGLLLVLILPFRALQSIFMYLTQPAAVADIKKSLKRQHGNLHDAVRDVNGTLSAEVARGLKTRWWKPNLSIVTSIRHYNLLAEYIRSLTRVKEATHDHLKKTHSKDDDKRY